MDELTWTPITVRLSALDFWERNPKRLTKAQAKRLADSTDRLGRAGVLLVGPQDARGRYPLYDGHQRANIWRTLYGADAEVHALQSNRELSEDERLSVSLLTVTAVGSLDFDALAGWDAGVLQDLGLGVDYKHELDDAAANIAAMLEALRADEEDADDRLGDTENIGNHERIPAESEAQDTGGPRSRDTITRHFVFDVSYDEGILVERALAQAGEPNSWLYRAAAAYLRGAFS